MKTAVIILGLVILFTVLASACYVRPEEPRRMSYDSLRLTVWDVRQPRLPGDHSYEDEVARALNAFQELYGVEINLVFVNRREIVEFLSGDSVTTDPPALIYSTEWPVISEMMVDVTQYIDTSEYNTSAVDNWTIDGKLIGIPSFYHWLVAAAKESEEDMVTGYWLESPAFRSLLGDWKHGTRTAL